MKLINTCGVGLIVGVLLLVNGKGHGQSKRVLDHNAIGWYVYNGDHRIADKWSIHTEYQWRRIDLVRTWQQSLARVGAAYKLSERVKFAGGYTYLVTFPYGAFPQADLGEPYPEQRIYQDVELSESYGRLHLAHRFRLEQRWLGVFAKDNPRQVADWAFQNRIRYQVSGKLPFQGATIENGNFYLNFFDELFIGFGKLVNENIYNQNRISAGIGYQVRKGLQIEMNYLNQILQHARLDATTGRPVLEINNGFRVNVNHSIDFTKRNK
ncbi:DUF2490 domain-containing protein [Spirosoma arcticum]